MNREFAMLNQSSCNLPEDACLSCEFPLEAGIWVFVEKTKNKHGFSGIAFLSNQNMIERTK
jgi:hypothetical protein